MVGDLELPWFSPNSSDVATHHEETLREAQGLGRKEVVGQEERADASGRAKAEGGRGAFHLRPRPQFHLPEDLPTDDGEV